MTSQIVPELSPGMTPQEEFDSKYITSNELQFETGVSRASIMYAKRTGKLPPPISIRGTNGWLWEREVLTPYMLDWKKLIASHRIGANKKRGPLPVGHNNLMARRSKMND